MLAINSDRTQYVLLTSHELDKCTNVVKDFCTIKSPLYPVHLSKTCLVALFMEKANAIKTFCEKVVHVSNLPLAQYISDGQWAVSTVQELKFSQVCPTSERGTETTIRSVKPPVGVLRLPMSCRAVHGQITLSPYFRRETTVKFPENHLNITIVHTLNTKNIWEKFHRTLQNFTYSTYPFKLNKIKHIEMDDLQNVLKYMYFPPEEKFYLPHWSFPFIGILGILLIVVCLIGIKCRKRIKSRIIGLWNAKGDSGEYKMSVLPTYAAVKTQGGDIPTLSTAPPAETEPTATLLPQQSPETLRMTAEHGPIYPNLPRFELITSRASSLIGSAPTSITD